ncbi:MAG: tRNA pseudouridine(55) synthase TruB [Flavobacteriales bacterium]
MTIDELRSGRVFLIDKPLDWTSFDVVNKLRWHIKREFDVKAIKVGHAGTLDPKATGLLIVCTGKATREIAAFQNLYKAYTGTLKLGASTPSSDTETAENEWLPTLAITEDSISEAAMGFQGEREQLPPAYSAIRQNGKRLYELARSGKKPNEVSRKIHIYSFTIKQIAFPFVGFTVRCSKGTYIRALARDFGKALHNKGYLTELRRTETGPYALRNALSLAQTLDIIRR